MKVEFLEGISQLGERDWNRLSGTQYPFLRHEFLRAAEETACVSAANGWTPRHVALFDGTGALQAAMPLYEKTHSWGEFVFDWAWAQAYASAGFDYYPKLVSATPFTPATSRRILLADTRDTESASCLIQAALKMAEESKFSSLHVQFPHADELPLLTNMGFKLRTDCQFHWHNRDYSNFEQFLQQFSSAKRKKARRDRRRVAEQGITFRWLAGNEMDNAIWRDVFALISMTFLQRGSMPYFNLEFFLEVSRQLPEHIGVVLAERQHQTIAAAVFFVGDETLYGRYWGSDSSYDALHFETCYYQGIDYCISKGLKNFEPGTQGEHKISRGFGPVTTWSAHWLSHAQFFEAVGRYLDDERRHIDDYVDAVRSHSPYKKKPEQDDTDKVS
jgi:predicted N-acyltransferase